MAVNSVLLSTLKLTSSLLELHDENAFKIRAYQNAHQTLDKIPYEIASLSNEDIAKLPGIGSGMVNAIHEINSTGTLQELEKLLAQTPKGVIQLFDVSGLGPKKVKTIWKELGVENVQQLLEACNTNKIAQLKGFGEKTQEGIKQAVEFILSQGQKMLIHKAQARAENIVQALQQLLPEASISKAGEIYEWSETVEYFDFIIASASINLNKLKIINEFDFAYNAQHSSPFRIQGIDPSTGLTIRIHFCTEAELENLRIRLSSSNAHLAYRINANSFLDHCKKNKTLSEKALYESFGSELIPAECRVGLQEWELGTQKGIEKLIQFNHLKGIFHNHSTYSDGVNTVAEMAEACRKQGWSYFGIADHSKTAYYAGGLYEEKVLQQFKEIDALNATYSDFKIFKGIESDILIDGQLDYDPELLQQFDYVVASIHQPLKMDLDKAMQRLITAIENPYTTMLGHMTGRLLLKREGYPVDHKKIIDACAANKVMIEINANPYRLDIDWRYLNYAQEKGVLISINPDAHEIDGILDTYYGVMMGRKGGLLKTNTFNAFTLEEVDAYFKSKK
jgi:DNA polymerase (family 10)